ncbi:hypothetical protein L4D09_27375 [Photobacterium makurazakiensis]|uniref:hypothetical protein n=1 Tax=Photobacterium makurazakiensis TaxID=2910234 RepID=UPI003D0A809D
MSSFYLGHKPRHQRHSPLRLPSTVTANHQPNNEYLSLTPYHDLAALSNLH